MKHTAAKYDYAGTVEFDCTYYFMLDIALKEWAATCLALERGEQIILLRKGGLRDEAGAFQLESNKFWLLRTFLHQDEALVKPAFRSLLQEVQPEDGEGDQFFQLSLFAEVAQTWALAGERAELLARVPHIWSEPYLNLRRSFRPDEPIICAALRVYRLATPHRIKVLPQHLGCRSWVEVPALTNQNAVPCLADAAFIAAQEAVRDVLGTGGSGT